MATFYTRPASYQGNDFQGRNIRYNIQMKKSRKQYFLLALLPAVLIAIGYILIKISSKGMTVHEVEMNDKLLRPVHSTPVLITSSTSEVPATKEFLPPTKKNPIKVSKDELVDTGETHGKKDDEGSIEKFITYILRLWKESSKTHKQCSQEEVLSAFTSQLWENKVEIIQLFSQAQWTFITLALELTVVFIMTFSKATWTFITLTLELMLVSIMAFLKATWIFLKRMSESKLVFETLLIIPNRLWKSTVDFSCGIKSRLYTQPWTLLLSMMAFFLVTKWIMNWIGFTNRGIFKDSLAAKWMSRYRGFTPRDGFVAAMQRHGTKSIWNKLNLSTVCITLVVSWIICGHYEETCSETPI